MNFDLNEGNLISLSELFLPNSFGSLLDEVFKGFDEEDFCRSLDNKENYTDFDDFDEYYLDKGDLVIVFGKYEAGPGACGVIERKVPYDLIKSVVDPNSYLGFILK